MPGVRRTARKGTDRLPARDDAADATAPAEDRAAARARCLAFGPFRLYPAQRLLFDGDVPVRLGRRTFDLLVLLAESPETLFTDEDLIARLWPGVPPAQVHLADHVEVINRLFRRARPMFEPAGGGYRFVMAPPLPVTPDTKRVARLIGRDDLISDACARLAERRFVTLVGPGGIGKTSIAMAVAGRVGPGLAGGVCVVDLAPVAEERLLPDALAAALGVPTPLGDPVRGLVALLEGRNLLIVLDNCEHVIDAAAALAEALVTGLGRVWVLATSREPLHAQGEWLLRVAPMGLPAPADHVTAREALSSPAVQLFVERAGGALDAAALGDDDAARVVDLCRRLDGIPLAIELAAAHVEPLGIAELSRQLAERQLTVERDGARPGDRHRTLQAAIDWSVARLSVDEQAAFQRLAVFRGEFSHEDGAEVVADDAASMPAALEQVADLAAKSLLAIEARGDTVHYRLFETTRAFAAARLAQSPDARGAHRRHALHCLRRLHQGQHDWEAMPRDAWRSVHGRLIDDVRAAIDWCFHPGGDVRLGVEITADAVGLADQLGLRAEFRDRADLALRAMPDLYPPAPRLEVRLLSSFADFTQQTNGAHDRVTTAFTRALRLADELGSPEYRRGPLMGQWVGAFGRGEYPDALHYARQLMDASTASRDDLGEFIADRMLAQAHHFLGDHAAARRHAERVLMQADRPYPLALTPGPTDVRSSMRVMLARIHWLQGDTDGAVALAEEAMSFAENDRAFALSQVLGMAVIPIALWRGRDADARRHLERLASHARRHQMRFWSDWAQMFEAVLVERAGGAPAPTPTGRKLADLFATLVGRVADAESLVRAEVGVSGWAAPEVFRAQGEAVWRAGGEHAAAGAETWLRRAHARALAQSAPAWALRAAISLGRLLIATGRGDEARVLLDAALAGAPEGPDAEAARALRG